MKKDALFSDDRKYRYWLSRIWDKSLPKVMFIGLNPSTANEIDDDPTIRRCIKFAKSWGYGGMYMSNLYPFVSTDPNRIERHDIKGDDYTLKGVAHECKNNIVFCWGAFKQHKIRMLEVIYMFPGAKCLGVTKNGYPKHPLYLKSDTKLEIFNSILK